MGLRHANLFAPDNGLDHVPTKNTGEFFLKVKFFLGMSTTLEFSRQKVDINLIEKDTFQSIPNLK